MSIPRRGRLKITDLNWHRIYNDIDIRGKTAAPTGANIDIVVCAAGKYGGYNHDKTEYIYYCLLPLLSVITTTS